MNQMTHAMGELREMDEWAALDSPIHRRHPLAKLLVTIVYVFTTASFSKYNLSGLIPMLLYPALLFSLSGVSVRLCFHKLRFILPLVLMVGIWNPFFDRTPILVMGGLVITGGMLSFVTLMLKGTLALMASFLLIATTDIEAICYALRLLHVPDIIVTQFLMTWRYISLLLREAGTMMDAYALRAPGQKGLHVSAWGSFVGQLLFRSMDRAKELHQSMQLRGFHGAFYYARKRAGSGADIVYTATWLLLFLLMRTVNLSELLGGLIL